MAETSSFVARGTRIRAARLIGLALTLGFAALLALNLGFFALHAAQMLRYPFPLDYGEGPLLAQVEQLRAGVALRDLYGPLDAPPYLVVNYPPVYLLVTWLVSSVTSSALLAGRLVSLTAALACVGALWVLVGDERRTTNDESNTFLLSSFVVRLLPLAFLALPIVREWAVVMRVDLLGVALGLWCLVVLQRGGLKRVHLVAAAALLAASVFCKPSLVAAPTAALVFVALRAWRRALELVGWLAVFAGAVLAVLMPGTHFFTHVVVANANAWQAHLAVGFWRGQLAIHWGVFAAGILGAVLLGIQANTAERTGGRQTTDDGRCSDRPSSIVHRPNHWANAALPIAYTLAGAIAAIGVGKVGAYLNYFLELYAGLIWLAVIGVRGQGSGVRTVRLLTPDPRPLTPLLHIATSLLSYYPTWSENTVKVAGVIEGVNPPRMIVGQRGVWQDLRRERQILAVQSRTNQALIGEIQAAGAPILTDVPGVAVQAGQIPRLQAFEHSQVLKQWDQRSLRLDLANGRVPLAVIDYLGNWLTPEVIALVAHRYAQEGARGGYDLYRPVDPGPFVILEGMNMLGMELDGYHLPTQSFHAGEIAPLTLVWANDPASQMPTTQAITVTVMLTDAAQRTVLTDTQPLFYGALRPDQLGDETAQHMQPLHLPSTLAAGEYTLQVSLQRGRAASPVRQFARLTVEPQTGALLRNGWLNDGSTEYMPEPILLAWRQLGGEQRLGLPFTPAVPFAGFVQQCFERGCLRGDKDEGWQTKDESQQIGLSSFVFRLSPVGTWLAAGDIGAHGAFTQPAISSGFAACYANLGGTTALGPPITNEFRSGERLVQYTEFARLERPLVGGACQRGAVGVDVLRLQSGVRYRWPGR